MYFNNLLFLKYLLIKSNSPGRGFSLSIPTFFVHVLALVISPCVCYVVIIWGCWCFKWKERVSWNSMSFSMFFLSKSIISTIGFKCGLSSPFSWVVFLVLGISPGIHSVVVIWNCWGLSEILSFLSKSIISTIGFKCSLSSPFSWVIFLVLGISPGIDSVVVIWNCWGLSELSKLTNRMWSSLVVSMMMIFHLSKS